MLQGDSTIKCIQLGYESCWQLGNIQSPCWTIWWVGIWRWLRVWRSLWIVRTRRILQTVRLWRRLFIWGRRRQGTWWFGDPKLTLDKYLKFETINKRWMGGNSYFYFQSFIFHSNFITSFLSLIIANSRLGTLFLHELHNFPFQKLQILF